jgi:gamma-glutamyl hydrolase
MALVALLGLSSLASRPTIGIYPTLTADNYLHAYQEWLDAAGADSVIFDKAWPSEKTERLFQSVNGFLIPGGGNIDAHSSVDEMVARAVKGNLVGDYFPVWGTCLGFEWLVSIFGGCSRGQDAGDAVPQPGPAVPAGRYCGGDTCMSAGFDAEDLPLPLTFTDAAASSRLYAATNKTEMHWLASEAITYALGGQTSL